MRNWPGHSCPVVDYVILNGCRPVWVKDLLARFVLVTRDARLH